MKESFPAQQNINPEKSGEEKGTAEKMQELMMQVMNETESYEIKPEDRNEKGELLVSPEGSVSNLGKQSELWWKIARTESFKKFFGDWQTQAGSFSKIVDSNGEPLVVFRGINSREVTDIYDENKYNEDFQKSHHNLGSGIYFTPNIEVANQFTDRDGAIFSAFIDAKKPEFQTNLKGFFRESKQMLEVLLPKKVLDVVSKILISNEKNYDSVFGYTTDLHDYTKSITKNPEELYELVLKQTSQVLIIPSITKEK